MKRVTLLILAILAASGCVREIEIKNEPAAVTSVGSLSVDALGNVLVPFTIRDLEGDDQIVAVDVCDSPGDNCGPAAEAVGGDPLERLPSVPKDTDVLHEFRWAAACGRWVDQTLVPTPLDDEFVVAVSVLSSDYEPVYSEPTSLAELGATEGDCE